MSYLPLALFYFLRWLQLVKADLLRFNIKESKQGWRVVELVRIVAGRREVLRE